MGIFRSLKRLMTGEIEQRIDTPLSESWTTMSLRLKRDRGSGELYVTMAALSSGNHQYFVFARDEFEQFAYAVETIGTSLREGSKAKN